MPKGVCVCACVLMCVEFENTVYSRCISAVLRGAACEATCHERWLHSDTISSLEQMNY